MCLQWVDLSDRMLRLCAQLQSVREPKPNVLRDGRQRLFVVRPQLVREWRMHLQQRVLCEWMLQRPYVLGIWQSKSGHVRRQRQSLRHVQRCARLHERCVYQHDVVQLADAPRRRRSGGLSMRRLRHEYEHPGGMDGHGGHRLVPHGVHGGEKLHTECPQGFRRHR